MYNGFGTLNVAQAEKTCIPWETLSSIISKYFILWNISFCGQWSTPIPPDSFLCRLSFEVGFPGTHIRSCAWTRSDPMYRVGLSWPYLSLREVHRRDNVSWCQEKRNSTWCRTFICMKAFNEFKTKDGPWDVQNPRGDVPRLYTERGPLWSRNYWRSGVTVVYRSARSWRLYMT